MGHVLSRNEMDFQTADLVLTSALAGGQISSMHGIQH